MVIPKWQKEFLNGFVDIYSSFYLLESEKPYKKADYLGDGEVSPVQQRVEQVADEALKDKETPWTADAWGAMGENLIAWKVGTLKYDESVGYYWNKRTKRGTAIVRIEEYLEKIKDNSNALSTSLLKKNHDDIYERIEWTYNRLLELQILDERKDDKIIEYDVKNFGPVYILTLIYFLSKGKFPIYDQFAHRAAKALYLNANPNDVFICSESDKTNVDSVLRMYNEYCWLLSHVFGQYSIERKEDQALWVYGHSKIKFSEQHQPLWDYGKSDNKSSEENGERNEYKLFNYDRETE